MGIPIGGSGSILYGGGNIALPPATLPAGLAAAIYPDTIEVFAATYGTDDDGFPIQVDGTGTTMAARVDWGTNREQPVSFTVPEGIRRLTAFTASDPGIDRPNMIVHVLANALGVFPAPVVLRSVDAATPPSGADAEWAVLLERRA